MVEALVALMLSEPLRLPSVKKPGVLVPSVKKPPVAVNVAMMKIRFVETNEEKGRTKNETQNESGKPGRRRLETESL